MRVSGGLTEDGIVVGNTFDKYQSGNPVVRWLMDGFHEALDGLVAEADPGTIHEVGCGEGYWVARWQKAGIGARGSDFSAAVIGIARENAERQGLAADSFGVRSIYELDAGEDSADLVVCCEVLEHLEQPERALERLAAVAGRWLIVSVPREPLWSAMNMARGRYWPQLGNTPGHVQRWSRRAFVRLVGRHFDVERTLSPIPWTMLLCRPKSDR